MSIGAEALTQRTVWCIEWGGESGRGDRKSGLQTEVPTSGKCFPDLSVLTRFLGSSPERLGTQAPLTLILS